MLKGSWRSVEIEEEKEAKNKKNKKKGVKLDNIRKNR